MSTTNCACCWGERGKSFLRELEVSFYRTKASSSSIPGDSLKVRTAQYKVLFKWFITLQSPNKKSRVHLRHCDNLDFKCDSLTGEPPMLTNVSYWNKPEVQLLAACKTAISAWVDRHRWWYLSNKDVLSVWISLQSPPSFPVAFLPTFSTTSVLFLRIKLTSFHPKLSLKLSHSIRCFQLDGPNIFDGLIAHVSLQTFPLAWCTCQMTTKQLSLTSHRKGQENNCPYLRLGPLVPFLLLPLTSPQNVK